MFAPCLQKGCITHFLPLPARLWTLSIVFVSFSSLKDKAKAEKGSKVQRRDASARTTQSSNAENPSVHDDDSQLNELLRKLKARDAEIARLKEQNNQVQN